MTSPVTIGPATCHHGDMLAVLPTLPEMSFEACTCDPPYHLTSGKNSRGGFMQAAWDGGDLAFRPETWREVYRVLKPGAFCFAFGDGSTFHRMAVAMEDAGFIMHNFIGWVQSQGFPKGKAVDKEIDRHRDDRGDIVRVTSWLKEQARDRGLSRGDVDLHMGTSDMAGWWLTDLAHRCQCPTWEQWGRLKELLSLSDEMDAEVWRLNGRKGSPGEAWFEREVVGRRVDGAGNGSVIGLGSPRSMATEFDITAPATPEAAHWQGWRYGRKALKNAIEPVLVAQRPYDGKPVDSIRRHGCGAFHIDASRVDTERDLSKWGGKQRTSVGYGNDWVADGSFATVPHPAGRYPSNLLHDGSPAVLAEFAKAGHSVSKPGWRNNTNKGHEGWSSGTIRSGPLYSGHADEGTPARFFAACPYEPDDFPPFIYEPKVTRKEREPYNTHNTLKPIALLQKLIRLTMRPGQRLLDPFAGSGSTLIAAMREGVESVGVELEPEHFAILTRRLAEHHERLAAETAQAEAKRAQASLFAEAAA